MSKQSEILRIKNELLEKQNWICPLCQLDLRDVIPRNICLDHDHDTGMIRGVLCRNCNSMEGKIHGCIRRAKRQLTKKQWFKHLVKYWKTSTKVLHPNHKTPEQRKEASKKRAKRKRHNNTRST